MGAGYSVGGVGVARVELAHDGLKVRCSTS
jgi:hypothetical protein